jgi:hypothetical protein
MTTPSKRIWLAFLVLIVSCVATMWPWSVIEDSYGRGFADAVNAMITWSGQQPPAAGIFGSPAAVKFEHSPNPQHDLKVGLLNISNPSPAGVTVRSLSSRHLGYMPLATLVSLIIASPVSWKRRGAALAIGVVAIHGFIIARVGLVILREFYGSTPHALAPLSATWDSTLNIFFRVGVVVPATTYLVPLVIWAATTFRRRDLQALIPATRD